MRERKEVEGEKEKPAGGGIRTHLLLNKRLELYSCTTTQALKQNVIFFSNPLNGNYNLAILPFRNFTKQTYFIDHLIGICVKKLG